MEKHISKKPRNKKPERRSFGGGIPLPPELLPGGAIYESLPTGHDVAKKAKQDEYINGLSEEDKAKYDNASKVAKTFQSKYMFKIDGKKYPPFTFNFKSAHWTVTWDKEWYEKAKAVPELLAKIENLIKLLAQLAPHAKDKSGKDIVLADEKGNPLKTDDGNPMYKTNLVADRTFERK